MRSPINLKDLLAVLNRNHIQGPVPMRSSRPEVHLIILHNASSVVVSESNMGRRQVELLLADLQVRTLRAIEIAEINASHFLLDVRGLLHPLEDVHVAVLQAVALWLEPESEQRVDLLLVLVFKYAVEFKGAEKYLVLDVLAGVIT